MIGAPAAQARDGRAARGNPLFGRDLAMTLVRIVAVVISMALAIACARADDAAQARTEPDSIGTLVQALMRKRHITGLQVAIVQHGKITKLAAYGLANIQDSVPVTKETVFQVNSITKAFTGVAIMQLVEDGKLDVSAPISRYLDDLPAAWHAVTVRQLLTHMSGLPDVWDNRARLIANTPDATWAKVQTLPIEFAPGERFQYNQNNYVVLGRLIDKLAGQPFTDFIKTRQFDVVGMPLSGFHDSFDVVPHSARVYRLADRRGADKLSCVYDDFPPFLRTAVGINSTAEEIARWIIALQSGRLLKHKESLATLWTRGVLNDGSTRGFGGALQGYALGWATSVPPEQRCLGNIGGGRSAFFVFPDHDLAVVILGNLQGAGPDTLVYEVAGHFVPSLHPSAGFGLPPAIKALRTELVKRGFDHAIEVASELQKNGARKLDELQLNDWGYLLLQQGQLPEAIEIFKVNVNLYPKSWNTYDSLGEAYEAHGDRLLAIQNYRRSLELNPKNANGVEHLKGLERDGAK
jgi:CubicO group peptidase (beta-lactamase class C family)